MEDISITKLSFEELLEFIKNNNEGINLEYKSFSFSRDKSLKNGSVDKLKAYLTEYCSAFANSNGGSLLIGVKDDKTVDEELVDSKIGNTIIEKWAEDVLRSNVQPSIQNIKVALIKQHKNSEKGILAINIQESKTTIHQDLITKKYYVRIGAQTLAADHWMIELIRNKRIHPEIQCFMIKESNFIELITSSDIEKSAVLTVYLRFQNIGKQIANDWGFAIRSEFGSFYQIVDSEFTQLKDHDPQEFGWKVFFKSKITLFPGQTITAPCKILVPINIDLRDSKFGGFSWRNLPKVYKEINQNRAKGVDVGHIFLISTNIYADSAPTKDNDMKISTIDLENQLVKNLKTFDIIK